MKSQSVVCRAGFLISKSTLSTTKIQHQRFIAQGNESAHEQERPDTSRSKVGWIIDPSKQVDLCDLRVDSKITHLDILSHCKTNIPIPIGRLNGILFSVRGCELDDRSFDLVPASSIYNSPSHFQTKTIQSDLF